MTSAFSRPILVRKDKTSVALNQVPVTHKGQSQYDEAWLQQLLYRHPDALPISEIDDSFSGIIPLCIEMDTPAGPIDAVYITPSGRLALLEAKLWRNPEARRTVIGQILDYAKELIRWDYSRLDAAVRSARRNDSAGEKFNGIAHYVAERAKGVAAEHTFIDAVTKGLSKGDFLLLIAGDGIREGVGAITQFLDRTATMHFTFGLIECAIYEEPGGGHLVQPRILAQTTQIQRTILLLGENVIAEIDNVPEDEAEGFEDPELVAYRARHQAYWKELLEQLQLEEQQPVSKPAISTNQYFTMPKGSEGWVSAYLAQSRNEVGVYLTFNKGPKGLHLFNALEKEKDEINRALGLPVEWKRMPDGRLYVIATKNFSGNLLQQFKSPSQAWLADAVQRFVSVFRPRIDALLREGSAQ